MPPVVALTLGLVGTVALVRWCVREAHRINAELDSIRRAAATEPVDRANLPKLKRDPQTGEYRPG